MREEPSLRPSGFGTRYLTDQEKVWEHNAWDNVEWNDEMEERAQRTVEEQRSAPVEAEAASSLLAEPAKQWDAFYSQHNNKFFMDRNWLLKEFPELDTTKYPQDAKVRALEVGCGVGNTSFPLLQWDTDRKLYLYSCDYSSVAVDVLKKNEAYDESHGKAFVWDITMPHPDVIEPGTLDIIVCIYVLSAIHPSKTKTAIENLKSLLKPGGCLLVKDYGRFDLTQLRFKKNRLIEENLYCRGDGTLVYFRPMPNDGLYVAVAEVIERVQEKKQNLRSAVYDHSYQNKKKLLRLTCETVKYAALFDALLEYPEISPLLDEPAFEGSVAFIHVLLYEFLIGTDLKSATSRLKRPIFGIASTIQEKEKALSAKGFGIDAIKKKAQDTQIEIPRYARINEVKWTRTEALDALKQDSWKVVELAEGETFAERVARLQSDEVLLDPHIPELLVFTNSSDFHSYWMTEQRYLIMQDKASCLPAYLLAPPQGAHCLDACAAPGNKTSHLAAIVGENGIVYAFDRAADRVQTMKRLLSQSGVTNIAHVENADFLRTDFTESRWNSVEYAVVDPPCSGSGMVKRLDEWTGGDAQKERLGKLANLQAMLLKHTLKFPALRRVVYSTCSLHEEENEQVVQEVLREFGDEWELSKDELPNWHLRGMDTYEFGACCLRADPKTTLTNGFFVAVFVKRGVETKEKKKKAKKRRLDADDE
ncbi:unnamed protein product, partial [Mesorhabditis spiculigera]